MTKYCVNDAKRRNQIYNGFDEATALKLWHSYNNSCGDYIIDELDFEEPEEEDENTFVFYDHDYLTCLYGDDDSIKEDMKMAIEYLTGKEIEDFDLDYSDPGDSGNDATFWANNIKWKRKEKHL